MGRKLLMESYMIFGGIPYYFNMLDSRLSLPQNIDNLLINENGELHYEYDRLFKSLFKRSELHRSIIDVLSKRRYGYTRCEIIDALGIKSGNALTTALSELEQCGFIRKYKVSVTSKQGFVYQITDPFILFHHYFLRSMKTGSWMKYINTPGYHTWCGNTFEMVCVNHIRQIKSALGISGVETNEYTWRSRKASPGVQIDLIIDRTDGVINLCEMKYSSGEYIIDSAYERELLYKAEVFQKETSTDKSIHITLVTVNGLKKNEYSGVVLNTISATELFADH
ncbi:MAG: ATP-binding protein [Lachnospiraceae bacterium]|nr:ATP-binding protein [Lachnospiraceae bacterium]